MSQGDSYGGDQQYPAGEQYGTEQYAQYPAESQSSSKVSIPTILASAGVAAVISALVVTIGVVGLVISNNNTGNNNASSQTPTVVNLGAAQNGATQPGAVVPQAGAADPQAGAAAPQPGAAAPVPAEQVPASDGGAGAGSAPIPQATAPQGAAPQQPQAQAPAQRQQAVAAPQALTPGQLNTKVKLIMNTGASQAARADELQAGARALGPVNGTAALLRTSGAGFTYRIIGPVSVSGNSLNATLQMSLVGQGSRNRPMTWVWVGNKWKLSNKSTCDVASYALVPCSL